VDNPPGTSALTESWNGTNWTAVANLATARSSLAAAGTNTAALGFGGNTGPGAATEEWNDPGTIIETITTS
jgi:hypothetical protein